ATEMHRFDDAYEIAFHECDSGAFDGDVGPRPHCNSDIGSSERRRVVNSVAGHCDDCTAGLQPFDDLDFLIGHHFRAELINSQLARNRFSRAPIVAGAHDDFQAHVVKRTKAVLVVGLMGSAMPRTPTACPFSATHTVVCACSCKRSTWLLSSFE